MPQGTKDFDSGEIGDIEIQIDSDVLADRLVKNPAFIAAVAKAVLVAMTKDARALGNLFGKWAQKQPPNPQTKTRL